MTVLQSMELVIKTLNLTSGWLHQMSELGKIAAAATHIGSVDHTSLINIVNVTTVLLGDLHRAACMSRLSLPTRDASTSSSSSSSCPHVYDNLEATTLLVKLQFIVHNRISVLLSTNATAAAPAATSSPDIVQSV